MGPSLGILSTEPRYRRLGPFRLNPQIVSLPSVDSSIAQVGQPLTATRGVYQASLDGELSILAEWRINGITVLTGPSYTPKVQDEGQLLEFVEVVTETGGGALSITALRTSILAANLWQTSLETNRLVITDSPRLSAPPPMGAVSETTITFLQEA